ncbi:MAG TPA: hypothetical protein EYQ50_20630 [Verrucomicrobiales bacterium]|jgi:uncharacterized coiled-coil protein SlyX|nr:hypothetical protein [Verrucomicrobiales bacterium]
MPQEEEDRLIQFESALAHLENQNDQLNKIVMEQGKILYRLESRQEKLIEALRDLHQDKISRDSRKPPHYQ